jgi:hypothetical protein
MYSFENQSAGNKPKRREHPFCHVIRHTHLYIKLESGQWPDGHWREAEDGVCSRSVALVSRVNASRDNGYDGCGAWSHSAGVSDSDATRLARARVDGLSWTLSRRIWGGEVGPRADGFRVLVADARVSAVGGERPLEGHRVRKG